MSDQQSELSKVTPPSSLTNEDYRNVFEYLLRHTAAHRNEAERYANQEEIIAKNVEHRDTTHADSIEDEYVTEINKWANAFLRDAWVACKEPGRDCPSSRLTLYTDTSTRGLPSLPPPSSLSQLLNTILLLHLTSSKSYSPHTRTLLTSLASTILDEAAAASTLKNPHHALEDAAREAEQVKVAHSIANSTWRKIGIGAGALAGGVIVGVSGGLAAPLVGAGVSTLLGALGAGSTAAGVLAVGLAGSSAVCGTLFGAYGAHSASSMVARHTKDVKDFDIVPIREVRDTLAVRICVSGWVGEKDDVTAPWMIFGEDEDTFALRWEIDALQKLSNALSDLVKSQALNFVEGEIIKRTILAALMSSLDATLWLKLGHVLDNPWSNARVLAEKTGKVLGTLLADKVLGARPVTLTGFSLGSLVIYHALAYLSTLPPSQTAHLIQDVFVFGSPAPVDTVIWSSARRIVAGRIVNGYAKPEEDYVLAVLSRFSVASITGWGVAGLQPVEVAGIENVLCEGVKGHVAWRGMVGTFLMRCGVRGIKESEALAQERDAEKRIEQELDIRVHDAGVASNVETESGEKDTETGETSAISEIPEAVENLDESEQSERTES